MGLAATIRKERVHFGIQFLFVSLNKEAPFPPKQKGSFKYFVL